MATQAQIETYNKIQDSGLVSKRRLQCYWALLHYGPCTGGEVKKVLRSLDMIPDTQSENVRNRLTELEQMGLIEPIGQKTDQATGMNNTVYQVIDNPTVKKLPKKVSKSDKIYKLQSALIDLVNNSSCNCDELAIRGSKGPCSRCEMIKKHNLVIEEARSDLFNLQ